MTIQVDSLVRGPLGIHTDRQVEVRVTSVTRSGVVAGIRTDNGRQAIIYKPTLVEGPRPAAARRDIPDRFR